MSTLSLSMSLSYRVQDLSALFFPLLSDVRESSYARNMPSAPSGLESKWQALYFETRMVLECLRCVVAKLSYPTTMSHERQLEGLLARNPDFYIRATQQSLNGAASTEESGAKGQRRRGSNKRGPKNHFGLTLTRVKAHCNLDHYKGRTTAHSRYNACFRAKAKH